MRSLSYFYAQISARLGISTTRLTAYLIAALSIFTGLLYVRSASSRDPGSLFFDPSTAYERKYSAIRQQQAEQFIENASVVPPFRSSKATAPLCIGVPSIARNGARYLRTTVGSLLAGLSRDERDGIHLVVFLAHTDPSVHPAYRETWLTNLADEVPRYNLSQEELARLADLERDTDLKREKGLFDYTYLLKTCYATGASYIAMIEDDVIAMDGWYHRTVAGLRQAEARSSLHDFLYLRLFYTEEYLGWNGEDWLTHAFWSFMAVAASVVLVNVIRAYFPSTARYLTPWVSIGICLILVPLLIVLFFAAGKVTVLPMSSGINEMNNYGCCAQGLVYPRRKAKDIIEWFEEIRIGFADMLVEQYANDHHEQRWAMTPSVLQHIGAKSSKVDDFGHGAKYSKTVAENIWNFAFEMNNANSLRREHELAASNPATLP